MLVVEAEHVVGQAASLLGASDQKRSSGLVVLVKPQESAVAIRPVRRPLAAELFGT